MKNTPDLQANFQNPPLESRSLPFWSLNDRLDPDEMRRQLKLFVEAGVGGVFLHSRIGLLTEYLGPDWWTAMDAGVEACAKHGVEAWFYDEDKWPSGYAGGLVPLKSDDFHARNLLRIEKSKTAYKLLPGSEVLAEHDVYLYVSHKSPMGEPWFNGTCWVDLLNPGTVKAFIETSYKPYAERYRSRAGGVVKGIFTDEPQVSPNPRNIKTENAGALAYSPVLRARFLQVNGYDLVDHVAALFEDTADCHKVRLDYYRTLGSLYEESFSKQIGEYCVKNGLVWTGHYNGENSLLLVLKNQGNLMIQYRHMQLPGMDHLGIRIDGGGLFAAKCLSSVANQYGQPRRLTELFGAGGQQMTFEDRKWIADWHTVLGINVFCPHMALYSLKGCRKRDHPSTISPQQPYWPFNKTLEDYMARVCFLSSQGRYAAETLMLVPLESAYMECRSGLLTDELDALQKKFDGILDQLQACHRDYDLGDEVVLADMAKVEPCKLVVGEMAYSVVVVPFFKTIRRSTLKLLHDFSAAGGTVMIVGHHPRYVEGVVAPADLQKLNTLSRVLPAGELVAALDKALPPEVVLEGEGAGCVFTQRRILPDGEILQLTNTSRFATVDLRLTWRGASKNAVVWDPTSGECQRANASADGVVVLRVAPAQTLFVTVGTVGDALELRGDYRLLSRDEEVYRFTGAWAGKRLDPNVLALDYARYSTDRGKTWSASEPVIGIHERLANRQFRGELRLMFEVDVEHLPESCRLVVEQPEMYRELQVNERPLVFKDVGFYTDASFRTTDVKDRIVVGMNRIVLVLDYVAPKRDSRDAVERYGTEIESIYLVGDFGVKTSTPEAPRVQRVKNLAEAVPERHLYTFSGFKITSESTTFGGELVVEGYPFYAGSFELSAEFEMDALEPGARYSLKLPEVQAVVVTCEVNGVAAGAIAWSPWETDITAALKRGKNTLTLTVVNTLRNLLGPHHNPRGELLRTVGPGAFLGVPGWQDDAGIGEFDWYDKRLTGKAAKWTDTYGLLAFGLLHPPVIAKRM